MSKASLKKALKEMSKEEIISVVCELYDVRHEARDYFEFWLDPDPERILECYKGIINKMYFYSTGKNRSQPALNALKQHVKYFSTLVFDAEKTADLMLYIAERQLQWVENKTSGYAQAESATRRLLDNARIFIESSALEDLYGLRLENLTEKVDSFFTDPPQAHRRRRWYRRFR